MLTWFLSLSAVLQYTVLLGLMFCAILLLVVRDLYQRWLG